MIKNPMPQTINDDSLIVYNHERSVNNTLIGLLLNSKDSSDVWVYVFEGTAIPANGTAPIIGPIFLQANTRNVSFEIPGGILINKDGLVIASSSDGTSFTVDAGATIDITALIEEYDPSPRTVAGGYSVAGDLTTTNRSTLAVWADAAGPKKVFRINVVNNAAAIRYLVMYAVDTADVGGADKIIGFWKFAANQRRTISFGDDGFSPVQVDADQTVHDGCKLYWQASLVSGGAVSTDATIQAFYK